MSFKNAIAFCPDFPAFSKLQTSKYIFCDEETGPTFGGVIITEMNDNDSLRGSDCSGERTYDRGNYMNGLIGWLSGEEKENYNLLTLEVFQIV